MTSQEYQEVIAHHNALSRSSVDAMMLHLSFKYLMSFTSSLDRESQAGPPWSNGAHRSLAAAKVNATVLVSLDFWLTSSLELSHVV